MDNLAFLTGVLKQAGITVYADLPHDVELRAFPCAGLTVVGPATTRHAFNAPGLDLEDIDVDVYSTPAAFTTGALFRQALSLRIHLLHLHRDKTSVIAASRPQRRPDRNPKIRRIGFTVTVAGPAAEL
ncbi:hypothetical protein [Corynebacterium pyruviciproducens]|uniref:hypothetical protein n=1 Tax=Corynebacterium pyruviciproducens TaxID=598660 RepID=UPI00288BFC69|nr:hypothetical protein [Corynebacterium pyruviciproducens]